MAEDSSGEFIGHRGEKEKAKDVRMGRDFGTRIRDDLMGVSNHHNSD